MLPVPQSLGAVHSVRVARVGVVALHPSVCVVAVHLSVCVDVATVGAGGDD